MVWEFGGYIVMSIRKVDKWIWNHFWIYDHVGMLFMPSVAWFKGNIAGNMGFYPALRVS